MTRARAARLTAALCGLLASLLLAELGLRLVIPALSPSGRIAQTVGRAVELLPLTYDQGAIDRIALGQAYITFDPDLGWVSTPGVDRIGIGNQGREVHYRHNRAGQRADRDYAPTPSLGVRRIAAYGDSFTYCETVDMSDCWTRQLEDLLPNSEALNFGVPAYGPDQAWLRYQRGGAAWHPCAVLIGYLTENVNRAINRFRPFYYPAPDTFPLAKPRYIIEGNHLELLTSPARRPDDLKDPAWVEANLGPHDFWYFPGMFAIQPLDWLDVARLLRTAHYRFEDAAAHRQAGQWTPSWARQIYRPGTEGFDVTARVLVDFADRAAAGWRAQAPRRAAGAAPPAAYPDDRPDRLARRAGGP